jgi:cysteine desulfurase/selenocysteine lyase
MDELSGTRVLFPITKEYAFINAASTGAWPSTAVEAISHFLENPIGDYEYGDGPWDTRIVEVKKLFAELIGCSSDEVAFAPTTSHALSAIATLAPRKAGLNVVTADMEFPSNILPWMRQREFGLDLRIVKSVGGRIKIEDVEKAVDDHTWAVSISHVEYGNGFRNNLKALSEIAHSHGAHLVVDGIQSVGGLELDVKESGVDFLACGSYKWLLGPIGCGFLFIDGRIAEDYEPLQAGWGSIIPESFDLSKGWEHFQRIPWGKGALRFEVGSKPQLSAIALRESLKLLLNLGKRRVEKHILELTEYLLQRLDESHLEVQSPRELESRSGIVNFRVKNPVETCERLRARKVIVCPRMGGIRASPHVYNNREDIDRLMDCLKEV